MRHIRKSSIYDMYWISQYLNQRYSNNLFGVVLIEQLVDVTDSAVLGGVAEVVSSNPTVGDKNNSASTGISLHIYLLYLSIYIYI